MTSASSIAITAARHPVVGTARPPGSKSYTNRALVLAALARGESLLEGALFSDDSRFTAGALRELGFPVVADEAACTFRVPRDRWCRPGAEA